MCIDIGNAAAMRHALSDACYASLNFLKTQSGGYEEMAIALDKAKAALAAPPRNLDVGTADERRNAMTDSATAIHANGHTAVECASRSGRRDHTVKAEV